MKTLMINNTKNKMYLGIDVGGTNIKYGVIDSYGDIIIKFEIPTILEKEIFLNTILKIISEIRENYNIEGIAFSFPGIIDYKRGFLIKAGALTFLENFNLKEYIQKNTKLNCEVENDVNTVAMAEKWNGNAKELSDFLCITIGTAIGGAIVINEQLYRGSNFAAGEFGYMITKGIENALPSDCGLTNIAAMFQLRKKYCQKYSKNFNEVTGKDIFDSQEPYAKYLVENMLENISLGLYNLLYILNPQKILIGGAISQREDLIKRLNDKLSILFQECIITKEIDRCFHGNDAGMIGAVYHYIKTNDTK